ncbi:MAG: hypothetical protein AAFS10_15135, partial [Myxococcota bacterium]
MNHDRSPRFLLLVCILVACSPTPPAPGHSSAPAKAEVSATRALLTPPTAAAPQTALMVVRMAPKGELSIGDLQPRPIAWTDRLVAFRPDLHNPPQPASAQAPSTPVASENKGQEPFWSLAVVVEHPTALQEPLVVPLEVMAPDSEPQGDVVDPWRMGGALWRIPWLGAGTQV